MANEVQPLASTVSVEFVGPVTIENNGRPPVAPNVNDNDVPGNPTIPGKARLVVGTSTAKSNENLAHVCDFVSEMQKNINLKKYIKAVADKIREAIRAVLKALGFEPTGQYSWLIDTLKSYAREIKRIQKQIIQPIIDFQRYVLAYITKVKAMIQWILSLPAKLKALLQECLQRLLKLVASVFSDIGQGLKESFVGEDAALKEVIDEAKKAAQATEETINSVKTAVAGAIAIPISAASIAVPVSQAELDAANQTISAYEKTIPSTSSVTDSQPKQEKSTP